MLINPYNLLWFMDAYHSKWRVKIIINITNRIVHMNLENTFNNVVDCLPFIVTPPSLTHALNLVNILSMWFRKLCIHFLSLPCVSFKSNYIFLLFYHVTYYFWMIAVIEKYSYKLFYYLQMAMLLPKSWWMQKLCIYYIALLLQFILVDLILCSFIYIYASF